MPRRLLSILLPWLVLSAAGWAQAAGTPPRLFLAGDSTLCRYPAASPIRGWGMALERHFADPAQVRNHAASGRSTKSFLREGRWEKLLAEVQPGDFVLIQFGHNDEKTNRPGVGTDAATEFRENLRGFVRDVRARHATPLLATPVARRAFDAAGKLRPTHGAYPDAIRAVARELDVPLLDLERDTSAWLQAAGPENSQAFFVGLTPGAHPDTPNAGPDNTHFLEAGAARVAELAIAELRALRLPLTAWLK